MVQALLEPFDLMEKLILAGKGYDSDKFVRWVEQRGGIVVISSRMTAKHPRNTDWYTYKKRHPVEDLFLKHKNSRCFSTKYERSYLFPCRCLPCLHPYLATLTVLKQTLRSIGFQITEGYHSRL